MIEVQKYAITPENIEQVLIIAREEALKRMAARLPHLEESEAIAQIIATAELDPKGPVASHFADYIAFALKSFF